MVDLTGFSFRDLLDYLPIIVTTVQSALVKALSWASPRFAQLQTWAKLILLFVAGFLIYLLLGLRWPNALALALVGTGAAALIYYFGRKPNTPLKRAKRARRSTGPRRPLNAADKDLVNGSPPVARGPVQG